MNKETKQRIKDVFIEKSGRLPLPHEEVNMLNDLGLVMEVLYKKVEELEAEIVELKKK